MTVNLPDAYDTYFYSRQLVGPEADEIAILTRLLYQRFHHEPKEVERQGDKGPYRIVVRDSKVESVLDVGCGMGAFLSSFLMCGVFKVVGVEHPHLYRTVGTAALPKEVSYEFLDLASPIPGIYLGEWAEFDLVLCLEVLEHLPARAADQLALALSRLNGRLVISAAHEGQGGTEHINERPVQHWIDLFADFGRRLNLEDTQYLRQTFEEACVDKFGSVFCTWYRDNLLIFDPARM